MGKQQLAIALTFLVMAFCYAATLQGMALQWWNDEDMGHGFLVPVVIGWILWMERKHWLSIPPVPSAWGIPVLAIAFGLHAAGSIGVGLFASSLALWLSVTGAILCLGGTRFLRAWAFPVLLALFMLPKLAIVYNQATLPLQLLASKMAAGVLTSLGIGVIRSGNILDVGGHRVAVAEACNGIRFLLPLAFMALVIGYIADPKPWVRTVLMLSTIPVAITANALRVAAAACIPALDSGTPHEIAGVIFFLISLVAVLMAHWTIKLIYERFRSFESR
jgi:exosortase